MKYYLNEYRAISYIAENMDFIQESLFNNSKKVIQRNKINKNKNLHKRTSLRKVLLYFTITL